MGNIKVSGGEIGGERNKYEISEVLVGGVSLVSCRGEEKEWSGCWGFYFM